MKLNLSRFMTLAAMVFCLIFSAFAYTSPPVTAHPEKAIKNLITHDAVQSAPAFQVETATATVPPDIRENSRENFTTNHELQFTNHGSLFTISNSQRRQSFQYSERRGVRVTADKVPLWSKGYCKMLRPDTERFTGLGASDYARGKI